MALNLMSLPDASWSQFNLARLFGLFAACLMTGLFEEIIYRGLIQNLVLRAYPIRPGLAIILASAIFALSHLLNLVNSSDAASTTLVQVVYTFFMGTLLGVSYYLTGSLLKVVLVHAAFNFFGQFVSIFAGNMPTDGASAPLAAYLIQLVLLAPSGVIALVMWRRQARNVSAGSLVK